MSLLNQIDFFLLTFALFAWKLAYSSSSPLPSDLYLPGPGVYFETWLASAKYFPDFTRLNNYPDCPTFVSNGETFEHTIAYSQKMQHGRFRAVFIPKMTGKHRFFIIANNEAQLSIELNPEGPKKILNVNSRTTDDWNQRKWSEEVNLMVGFRYELTAMYYGNGKNPEFFRLGVEFPDKSEEKPISKNYLWRSMEFYKWKGLIAHKYDNFKYPAGNFFGDPSEYSLEKVYSMNPDYPNTTSSYQCKPTLYDDPGHRFDYYALRYIGYMNVSANGTHKFRMNCNELCEFFLTRNDIEASLGTYNDNWEAKGLMWTEMDGGVLSPLVLYPIKVFFTESLGNDYLQIRHQHNNNAFSTSWNGKLRNLLPKETAKRVPVPIPKMINSTAISAYYRAVPFLPPRDTWSYIQRQDILFHRNGVDDPVQAMTVNGTLPQTVVVTGLKKYTEYLFYAHYYGKINGQDHNIITRYSAAVRTDEDVPESAPTSVTPKKQSSTTIRVLWVTLSDFSHWNGIGLGFEVQYMLKSSEASNWTSYLTTGISNRQYYANNLLKYRIYKFRVAARTSKGSGPFSSVVEERTKEDIPSAGPTNLTAWNTSSTSVHMTWNEIPFDHQNGIILGYRIYIRKGGSIGGWFVADTSEKYFTKAGLELWTMYDVKVSGRTSVGEGNLSEVFRVRTDQDVPNAAPLNITATAVSANWLNMTWLGIKEDKRNGIILSYVVKYKRTDGKGAQDQIIVYEKSASLQELAAYEEYDISVAGATSKGHGVFSSTMIIKTLQSGPDAAPVNLRGNHMNSTAIKVEWDPVPEEDRNGIITRYIVRYRAKETLSSWQEIIVHYSNLTLQIGSLEYYTLYEFKVAAETNINRGPFSNITDIRTDADTPTQSPMNLTGHFVNHTAIDMNWTRVPEEARHGIIIGYILHFRDATLPRTTWHNITVPNRQNGSDYFSQIVNDLKIYTPYSFKIQAFTKRGFGVISDAVTVWTDEHEPEESPRNISGLNASSTEIMLRWEDMKEAHGGANGKVLGYTIRYRVVDCHEDRPVGCDENEVFSITSNGSLAEIKISNLRKCTTYSLSVQVFNSKGRGNFSKSINITTGEDKPDMSPMFVETWPSQSDSIKIYWSPIPESYRNGIILGYRIFYKAIDVALRRYDRAPRSVNEFAIYGALPGEKMVEVNSSDYSVELKSLKDYSWYQVRIGAFTSKGLGVTFAINGTAKQESPIEAPKLEVIDMYDFTKILLHWEPISKHGSRGEVLGYRIQYWLSEVQETPVIATVKYEGYIFAPNRTTTLTGLQPFSRYRIRIQAFTEGGYGVWSQEHNGDTCRCSETITSATILLPPLVNAGSLEIIPLMLDKAIRDCCGNCSGKHGMSRVDWHRDSLGLNSVKHSKKEALDAIAAGTNLALPIFMDSLEMEGDVDKSLYVMVPLVQSKYLGIFIRRPTDREMGNIAASIISAAVKEQYPLLLISTVLTILAGILFWIFEKGINKEEFADTYFNGSGSGIWLAYITMTTVGYGDLTPQTKLGKLHAMIWMLIGLVLTSMVIGSISSIFSIDFVFRPQSFTSKNRVLTSDDTFMLAVQLYGNKVYIGNTSDGDYVQKSLLSGSVSKVVMDLYTASLLKDYLTHPSIMLEKVERVDGSFGVALSGETKRIKNCVNSAAKQNFGSMQDKVNQNTYMFEIGDERSIDVLQHMISPSSDIMQNLTFYGVAILAVLVLVGIVYDVRRCIRGRSKVKTDTDIRQELACGILEEIKELESAIVSLFDKAECKHAYERSALSKMQYAKYAALATKYPGLHTFDPEIPKLKSIKEARKEKPVEKLDDDIYSGGDRDMPIYYRTE